MFGKDRQQYTSQNVFSDDEDMEADATVLEREEAYSARIAKKEDILAIQEEERHDEEKRRRKREKERAAARGQ
jgi:protein SPT2